MPQAALSEAIAPLRADPDKAAILLDIAKVIGNIAPTDPNVSGTFAFV